MTYKLTVDIGLMSSDYVPEMLDKLKRWETEGKIELQRPEAAAKKAPYTWPGATVSKPMNKYAKAKSGKDKPGQLSFARVAAVLYPQKSSTKLDMYEINDVARIVHHHSTKNEFFLTGNTKGFIEDGKRERLKASFGVIAVTPEEAIDVLGRMEGWK